MNHVQGWSDLLLLPEALPGPVTFFIGLLVFTMVVLFPLSFFLNFAERKLIADLQARVGPNRAGGHGILQGPADLAKELSRTPTLRDGRRKRIWYTIAIAALYSSLGALPLGSDLVAVDSEISALLPLLSFSIAVFAITLAGIESWQYETLLSSLRRGFQHWSAVVPAILSTLAVGVVAESLEWRRIGEIQHAGLITAMIFRQPLLILAFLVFQLSGMVLFGMGPFQSSTRGEELLHNEYGLGFFHRFYAFFAWCLLSSVLFLGGWEYFGFSEPSGFRSLLGLVSLLIKATVLYLLSKVLSRGIPRLRLDQMTDFSWKILAPLATGALILCSLVKAIGGAS